jgi:hypothetical protein
LGYHKEKKPGEVWITSVQARLFATILPTLETKRAGSEDEEGFVPVFISEEEFEMETRPHRQIPA